MRDTNSEPEPVGVPVRGTHMGENAFVVVEEELGDEVRDIVPLESELGQHVANRAISVSEIQPRDANGYTILFGILKSFLDQSTVFDASSDTFEKGFLNVGFNVVVFGEEPGKSSLNGGEENPAFNIENRDRAHLGRMATILRFFQEPDPGELP